MQRRAFLQFASRPRATALATAPRVAAQPASRASVATPPPAPSRPVLGGLEPYVPTPDAPWDRRRAAHLLRRTGFGHTPARATQVLEQGPSAAVDQILDAALAAPLPAVPSWVSVRPPLAGAPQAEQQAFAQTNLSGLYGTVYEVFDQTLDPAAALRERMAIVWHGQFVTKLSTYGTSASWLYRYWTVLRRHALGGFKSLVHEIGTTPAMLRFLDGYLNARTSPNENYARELLELFTMGIFGPEGGFNYTQQDVSELARVLTGWRVNAPAAQDVFFDASRFDPTPKTVFGQTGTWGYSDVVTLLFNQRAEAIAHAVARRLYRQFVHDVPDESVVDALAEQLLASDFQIAPVLRTLLKSAHFFNSAVIGALIKSPLDLGIGFLQEAGFSRNTTTYLQVWTRCGPAGQSLFEPPNVAGWSGGRDWMNASGLSLRWTMTDSLIAREGTYKVLAMDMPDPYHALTLAQDLAQHFLGVPVSEADAANFALIMLAGTPDYAWNPFAPEAEGRIRGLVEHLTQLPEYQLR